jgi:hypothetical protein
MRRLSSSCLNADVDVAEAVVALQKASESKHVKSNHVLTESREQSKSPTIKKAGAQEMKMNARMHD